MDGADRAADATDLLDLTPDRFDRHDQVAIVGFNDSAWIESDLTFDHAQAIAALAVGLTSKAALVILGAEELGFAVGELLRETGGHVIFADSNPGHCRTAQERGFPVVYGNALEHVDENDAGSNMQVLHDLGTVHHMRGDTEEGARRTTISPPWW